MELAPPRPNLRYVLAAAAALSGATLWLATQGGVTPQQPAAIAAVLYLVIDAAPLVMGFWLAAAGLGFPLRLWLLRGAARPWPAQLALGAAMLLQLSWAMAWAGLLTRTGALALLGVGTAGAVAQAVEFQVRSRGKLALPDRVPWSLMLWAAPATLMVVAACCPPGTLWRVEALGYDVLSYHLQLPREWLAAGGLSGLHHNVYSYLPNLVESGYLLLGAARGGVLEAVYACQLLHVSFALLAAWSLAAIASRYGEADDGAVGGATAGAALLATPWVLITATLAYNEMVVLALGGVALLVALDQPAERWRGAAAVGALAGAATLAKLPAGPMVALPLGVILLLRLNHTQRWRQPPSWGAAWRLAAIAAAAGLLMLSPYLARNAVWTGNPLFPFTTHTLGLGHWDGTLAQRWEQAHGLTPTTGVGERAAALIERWLFSSGYGGIAGAAQEREARNVAQFDTGDGFPLLWCAVAVGAVLAWLQRPTRRLAVGMLLMLVMQLTFWLTATHLQSRFLVPTLLPGGVLLGVGSAALRGRVRPRRWWAFPSLAVFLVSSLGAWSFVQFASEPLPAWVAIDSLGDGRPMPDGRRRGFVGWHQLNDLPDGSKALIVADNSRLLYIRIPIIYNSAFDANPLGEIVRRQDRDPAAVTRELRGDGVTHVWVDWSELRRLHNTYGFDADVTEAWLRDAAKAAGWSLVFGDGQAVSLFELP